ncbi:MAG TPA: serine/threonine protein kinase, partial [Candidatus Halomonas stercoripullorum]|nr:serine/threonine protein kinase [Candidatus Halomonas stercoripullorum]
LLTGELPYVVSPDRLRRHTDLEQLEYRSARSYNPDVPIQLDEALRRALDPQRSLRFRRLSELLYALRHQDGREGGAKPHGLSRPGHGSTYIWQVITGVLVLLLLLSWWLR